MPRQHWARRCAAHRSDGQPCTRWAIRGGRVCAAHGGSLRRTRDAAEARLFAARSRRAYEHDRQAHQRALVRWQAARVAVAARLLGIEPGAVTHIDIAWCRARNGVPEGIDQAPRMRHDRRFFPVRERIPGSG